MKCSGKSLRLFNRLNTITGRKYRIKPITGTEYKAERRRTPLEERWLGGCFRIAELSHPHDVAAAMMRLPMFDST